jgi:hypothetical protein
LKSPRQTSPYYPSSRRFRDLLEKGATAFYLDTYGSSIGCYPMSAEGMVYYAKHLRELAGPECLIFTEHGFDATHLFAAIWPSGEDELGKRPLGEYARWLAEGTVEIVRVKGVDGARRAWAEGGIPIFNDNDLAAPYAELQRQFVREDGSSIARPDCPPPQR